MADEKQEPIEPELRLARRLVPFPIDDVAREEIDGLAAGPIDWSRFMQRAKQMQAEPLIYRNVRAELESRVPDADLDAMVSAEKVARAYNLTNTLRTMELVREISSASIDTIVLKGPALGVTAFGDPSLRSFGDIDLLVHRSAISDAARFLEKLGLESDYPLSAQSRMIARQNALEYSGRKLKVELHWQLIERYLHVPFDLDDVWRESREVDCAGTTIRVLSPHHEFVFACVHAAKHLWGGSRWLIDVHYLLNRLDEKEIAGVADLSAQLGVRRIVAMTVEFAMSEFGIVTAGTTICDQIGASEKALSIERASKLTLPKWLRLRESPRDAATVLYRRVTG